jgi:hypothetical protein
LLGVELGTEEGFLDGLVEGIDDSSEDGFIDNSDDGPPLGIALLQDPKVIESEPSKSPP